MMINFMNIDIRGVIVNNFKNDSSKEMVDTINESLKSSDELILPGLGVLFEVLWQESSNDEKLDFANKILKKIS